MTACATAPSTSTSTDRIVVWPHGRLSLACHAIQTPSLSSAVRGDAVSLAIRAAWYWMVRCNRERNITADEWQELAKKKLRLDSDTAAAIFAAGNTVAPNDLLTLCLVLSSLGSGSNGFHAFVKAQITPILTLCFLFDDYVRCSTCPTNQKRLEWLPEIRQVPFSAFHMLDTVLAAAFVPGGKPNVANLRTSPVSAIMLSSSRIFDCASEKTKMSDLATWLGKRMQPDVFALDPFDARTPPPCSSRSLTTTAAASDRKLTISGWPRIQLHANPLYRGAHLRIIGRVDDLKPSASFFFHLTYSRSVVISNISGTAPIVLGPVDGLVVLDHLCDCRISVVARQIIVRDCSNVTLFAGSPDQVVFIGGCFDVALAPYNVWFDALPDELAACRLPLTPASANPSSPQHHRLPPNMFYIQPTPFPSSQPFSQAFENALQEDYLACWRRRSRLAAAYAAALSTTEVDLISPLPLPDIAFLRRRCR